MDQNRTSLDPIENTHQLSTHSLRSLRSSPSDDLNHNQALNLSYYDNLDDLNEFPRQKFETNLFEYENKRLNEIIEQASGVDEPFDSETNFDLNEIENSKTHELLTDKPFDSTTRETENNFLLEDESAKESFLNEITDESFDVVYVCPKDGFSSNIGN